MQASRCRVGLLPLLFAAACDGGPNAAADDRALAALLPATTVAYVHVTSLDALLAPAREVATAVGADAEQVEGRQLLAQLGGLAGDTQWIDQRRPFAFALSAPKATRPTPLLLVPATDPAKYAASLQAQGLTPVVDGGYVVVAIGGKYEKATTPSKLAEGLPAGIVSMRVDVEKVAANLGGPIGMGLSAFQAEMAKEMQRNDSGLDGEALAEIYMRAARALLASTSAMDLGFDYRDGRLLCAASLTAKAGSDMDGWSSAPIDLSTLSGRLSGKGSIELLMAADWARLWPRMETMLAALYELYPAPARDAMRTLMTSYGPVYEIAGPIVAAEGDVLGDDGMHLVMQMAPRDAKSFLSAIETVMARPECAQIGARFTKVASPDADGAIVREYLLQYDPAKMLGEQASGAQAQKQMTAVVKAMFGGGGMPMRFAAKDGRAVVTLGKPKEDVASSLAGNRGGWSPLTGEALRQVGDCNPMLIERIDMGALMSGMARMMPAGAAGKPMPKVPAGSSADFVFRAGIRDREWRFGLAIDVIGFSKMMKAAVPR